MSIRNGLIFALASVALLSACKPDADENANGVVKRSIITLTPVAPGNRNVRIGDTLQVKINAKTIEGAVSTPAAGGTVTLAVEGPGAVGEESLKLDSAGSGVFTFVTCNPGDEGCEEWASVIVTAVVTIDGVEVNGNIALTLRGQSEQTLDCSACGTGCLGRECALEGEAGVCNATVCVVPDDNGNGDNGNGNDDNGNGNGNDDNGIEKNDLFQMQTGLFDLYGIPLDPARIAINSLEPVEVRVTVKSAVSGAAVKDADVVVTAFGDIGRIGLDKETPAGDRAVNVSGKTGDKGVFSAFVFAGSVMARGGVVVESSELSRRIEIETVQAGILSFLPGDGDNFVRIMGVAESGYREQNTLRFRLFDKSGRPFVGGATVNFEIIGNPGGVSIFPATTRADANGEVTVNLLSGRIAGTVLVRASAVVDNDPTVTPTTVSDSIAIVGAKVSGRNIAVSCERQAVPALVGNDCSFMKVDESTLCTAVLGDRYNNAIGRSVSVAWSTEAGLFGPPSKTEIANPDTEPTAQATLGRTSNTLRTLNARMPRDVEPLPGEVSRVGSSDECAARDGGIRVFNPRDGLVTFIVHTKGEEGFWDENNNGVYDEGEEFIDLGEPFVDANDNGEWDPGEEFIDTNDNGVYDGPNGKWDADTTIWAAGNILYTNSASDVTWSPDNFDPGVLATVKSDERLSVLVNWKDENLNATASTFSSYGVSLVEPAMGEVAVQSIVSNIADTFGFSVTQETICLPANNGACTLTPKLAGLSQVSGFTVKALYTAPATDVDTFDSLRATASVSTTKGAELTVIDTRRVDVLAAEVDDNEPGPGETNDDFRMAAGLFNLYGEPLDPARVAVNSTEPVEVRVTLTSVVNGAPMKDTDVVVTAAGGIGLVGLDKGTAPAPGSTTVTGKTGDNGVFRAYMFAGSALAKGAIVVQADDLTTRFELETVKAGILSFTPGASDNFVRIMGVSQSGYREQNTLRFRLSDTSGRPFVGAATVNFEIIGNPGGVSLFPATTRVDANGEATVNLLSGPIAGTVLVRATAVVDNDPTSAPTTVSDSIAIVGAKVSGRNIAVSCERKAVPALIDNDCSFMRVDENTLCTAVLGDRYNNAIGRSVSVFWSTEAGLFGPPSMTQNAHPDLEPIAQVNLGRTSNTLRTFNARMPMDVTPLPGEVSRLGSADECEARDGGLRTFNPRDGLVTFIVHTKGEEGFWDRNNNGVYDPGEEFIDVGEPFIDANDNGDWDPGEEFIDTNNNGVYDGPNGVWDADTTIWATGHILYTNHASLSDVTWTPTSGDPEVLASVLSEERLKLSVNWKDENLNATASSFSSYDVSVVAPALGTVEVQSLAEGIADGYGFGVTQQTTCLPTGACHVRTKLSGLDKVDGFTVKALYTAPETEEDTYDVLKATASVTARDGSGVTAIDERVVEVVGVPAGP